MQIEENKVYVFRFPTDHGDLTIPVPAQSREEAADKLQKILGRFQTELALEFPKISPTFSIPNVDFQIMSANGLIPPEVLEMRLDTLLADLGAGALKGKAKDDTIKTWTGHDNTPENYTHIITELELIKSGQKDIPPNGKKGKA